MTATNKAPLATSTTRAPGLTGSTDDAWRLRFGVSFATVPTWASQRPHRCAFTSNETGRWQLFTWEMTTGARWQVTDHPCGVTDYRLDASGSLLFWFEENADETGVWKVAPYDDPGSAAPAFPTVPIGVNLGLELADDTAWVSVGTDGGVEVHVSDLATGDARLATVLPHGSLPGPASPAAERLAAAVERHDSDVVDIWILDPNGVCTTRLSCPPGARALMPVMWDRSGDRLLLLHECDALAGPAIWAPGTGDLHVLKLELGGDTFASWTELPSELLLLTDHRGRSDLRRFDLDTATAGPRIETEPGSILDAAVRPDGDVWYVWSSAAHPPELRSQRKARLPAHSGQRPPLGPPLAELLVDGIPGFVARPPQGGPHPTVFLLHGGPDDHDGDVYNPEVAAWVDHGFAVALVNYRGSTGNGPDWADGNVGDPGFAELRDVDRVRAHLIATGVTDPERVIVAGGSWGGYLALLAVGTQPGAWAGAIAAHPIADYLTAYEFESAEIQARDQQLFGGDPSQRRELYVERSPISHVHRVRVPVQIFASEDDIRCPVRQVQTYVEAARAHGVDVELQLRPGGHHPNDMRSHELRVEAQLDFARRVLSTRSTSSTHLTTTTTNIDEGQEYSL